MVKTLRPQKYDEVIHVGHYFSYGFAVVMDLTHMAVDDATRLVDFATGLIVGLGGAMERLGPRVFLLLPQGMVGGNRPLPEPATPTGL